MQARAKAVVERGALDDRGGAALILAEGGERSRLRVEEGLHAAAAGLPGRAVGRDERRGEQQDERKEVGVLHGALYPQMTQISGLLLTLMLARWHCGVNGGRMTIA